LTVSGTSPILCSEQKSKEGTNIDMISTSEIKISVVIDLAKGEQAVKAVHAAFIG